MPTQTWQLPTSSVMAGLKKKKRGTGKPSGGGLVWVQNSAVSGFQRVPARAADPSY